MQNNDPKSENAAMKERAAKDKDQRGRQHNTVPHQHGPAQAGYGVDVNKDTEPKHVEPASHKEK